jgi:hypothetical protein
MVEGGKLIVGLAGGVIGILFVYFEYNKKRWLASLKNFKEKHHGYTTQSSPDDLSNTLTSFQGERTKYDVLLVVNPAAGLGKGQESFSRSIAAFEKRGRAVEVYVTSGSEDVMTLTQTKNLKLYKMIAFLSGDSTIMEFIQHALRENGETWPYAPILHLPGGSSNVLQGDAFGPDKEVEEVIEMALKADCVKKANLIKCTAEGSPEARYGTVNGFSGIQKYLVDNLDSARSTISGPFSKTLLAMMMIWAIFSYPYRKKVAPNIMTVMIADVESGGKVDLNFGVSRWDPRGVFIVLYQSQYQGLRSLLKALGSFMSGDLGGAYQKGERSWDKTLHVEVTNTWTAKGDDCYEILFDGSTELSVKGKEIHFEVVPQCLPLYTKG